MADRYQDRAYGVGHGRGGDQHGSDRGENDPLAELARLIGQTDQFGNQGKGGQAPPRSAPPRQEPRRQDVRQDYYSEDDYAQPEPEPPPAPAGPPTWMQRANIRREPVRETPREAAREYPRDNPRGLPAEPEPEDDSHLSAVHPLHRYAPQPQPQPHPQAPPPDGYYDEQPAYQQQSYQQRPHRHDPQDYAEAEQELDPSRYDDALYGQLENGVQDFQREPAYPDDPYAYQGEYDEELEAPRKRRRLPLKVAAVMALGVFGVGAAYGYHTYFDTTRSGEIPIIKADNSPTKIVPQQSDAAAKVPDRIATGDGTEKIVPREEQPVDVNSQNVSPRVVFPPLNQNANPPPVASVAPNAMPPADAAPAQAANNGTMPNGEPRKIKTFSVKGDQPDPSAVPVNTPPQAAAAKNAKMPKSPPSNANASAPLSLSPQGQSAPEDTGTQMASINPTQVAPASSGGGYLVSILSQPSEAEAQAAFRTMQGKYPSVLGSQSPVIARATTKSGAVTYRAGVSFATSAEAAQFCHNYQSAGGQCWVVKN
jgi:hypothetical protein